MGGYLGDANESQLFKHPGVTVGGMMRYLFDTRWALRGTLGMASISGDTADFDNVLPGGANYSFSATVWNLDVRGEFNFLPYGIGETYKRLRRLTPYLALGIGMTLSSSEGETHVYACLPMSVGLKYKLRERLNLGLEFTMTKVLGDNVDGPYLSDLYTIKSSFLKNTDWLSSIAVSITYEFGERCVVCNRVD